MPTTPTSFPSLPYRRSTRPHTPDGSRPRPPRIDPTAPTLTRIHLVARSQELCVSLQQLRELAVTDAQVESLIARGALTRVTRGVFILGPPPMTHAQLRWAALLTTDNQRAALSHTTAAELLGVLRTEEGRAWVTVPGQLRRRFVETLVDIAETGRPGRIIICSTRRPIQPLFVSGCAVTPAARTVVDVAAVCGPAAAQRAFRESDYLGLLSVRGVLAELGRGIAGSRIVRRLVAAIPIVGPTGTETPEEQLLLEAMRELGMPDCETQVRVRANGRRYRLDFFERNRRASLEAIGGVHRKGYRRREDARRTADLQSIGITEFQVTNEAIRADPIAAARTVWDWLEQLPIVDPLD